MHWSQGNRFRSASLSPNDEYILAVSSDDSNAWVWRVRSRGEAQPLVGHDGRIRSASFTPDGSRIVTVSDDRTIRIWRPGTLGSGAVLRGHDDAVRSIDFSGDGTLILTASDDGTARIWLAQPRDQHVLLGQRRVPVAASFSKDLLRIVSAGDRQAHLWQISGSPLPSINVEGHAGAVQTAEISPDDRYVVTGSEDASVRLWHLADSRSSLLMTHRDVVRWVSFSADGKRVVSASNDKTAQVATVDGSQPVLALSGHSEGVTFAAFSPDGTAVVTASDDRTARVWRLDNQTSVELKPHDGAVVFAAFSADGKWVATASEDHVARVWHADGSGEPVLLAGHTLALRSIRFSRDGALVVTVAEDGTVRIWSAKDGRILRIIPVDQEVVLDARLSDDKTTLVMASARLGSRSIVVHKVSWSSSRGSLMNEACRLMPRQLGGEERARFGLGPTDVSACSIPPQ